MGDGKTADVIMELKEPRNINAFGKHLKNFKQDAWENCRETIVESGNMAKVLLKYTQPCVISTYTSTILLNLKFNVLLGIVN